MGLKYVDFVSLKVIFLSLLALFGIPFYFYMGGTVLGFIGLYTLGVLVGVFAQIGTHRWLCHNSFEPRPVARLLMLLSMVIQSFGRPLHLVIAHRAHHQFPDLPGDPHSPTKLTLLQLWLGQFSSLSQTSGFRDFFQKKDALWVHKNYWLLWIIFNISFLALDAKSALIFSPLIFARGWLVNALLNYYGHNGRLGSPQNLNPILSWFCRGEGLHKNHHMDPGNYHFEREPGDRDPSRYLIEWLLMKPQIVIPPNLAGRQN